MPNGLAIGRRPGAAALADGLSRAAGSLLAHLRHHRHHSAAAPIARAAAHSVVLKLPACTSAPPSQKPSPSPAMNTVMFQVKASVMYSRGLKAPSCSDSAVIMGPKAMPVPTQASVNQPVDGASAMAMLPVASQPSVSRICWFSGQRQRRVP